ncbi:MAG TPA: bifunctional 4-hydroxy-2-oxoglutarate aldolase/2-dehydro-3-deoxy-phosphogluconate aldolase [Candidatus Limivivens intestinipullorum]|uniref:Bifunctional 4-hydroxy-2-oxoglutarate aldolase/2-dehydro-3-deoxy-phosphogluconate aldolase n=1 Tax=Candidatus Limivivens intestinipullorum TaxID=2840858 RepID=A0A9D1ERX0_9FIRM|nr:bifunctional 4-hydroxy-2-oxoglutarate aldolase/2-dehydro-3-deoxy-phosphogluconate aldolase [Candidatus Limivivens intestinipullorum]
MRENVIKAIKDKKIIAIVRGIYGENCLRLSQALLKGGIRLVEFTFDQSDPLGEEKTCESIAAVSGAFQGELFCGAGTVLTVAQVVKAREAGARFLISPNICREVIQATVSMDMVSIPGAFSPTEIEEAYRWGADFVKVFPISGLGTEYIRAVRAPLGHIPLLAVGGVTPENLGEFLEAGASGVGLGGELIRKGLILSGQFDKITELAQTAVQQTERMRT